MAQEEGNVVQLEGIIHAFIRDDGSLVIMTRKIDGNVWNASYGEEVTLSPEGVSNLLRLLGFGAVEQTLALDLALPPAKDDVYKIEWLDGDTVRLTPSQ